MKKPVSIGFLRLKSLAPVAPFTSTTRVPALLKTSGLGPVLLSAFPWLYAVRVEVLSYGLLVMTAIVMVWAVSASKSFAW